MQAKLKKRLLVWLLKDEIIELDAVLRNLDLRVEKGWTIQISRSWLTVFKQDEIMFHFKLNERQV